MNNEQTPRGNKPIHTLRDGSLKIAIFRNQLENGENYSMQPGRVYTDNNGDVRETKSFSSNESLRVARLFEKGYDRVEKFKTERKQQAQQSSDRERK